MVDLDTFCRYCSSLTTRLIDDSFYAEYGSESRTFKSQYYVNWCKIDNLDCPENVVNCPMLKDIELPEHCVSCPNIADCITAIHSKGLKGLIDCEFSGITR